MLCILLVELSAHATCVHANLHYEDVCSSSCHMHREHMLTSFRSPIRQVAAKCADFGLHRDYPSLKATLHRTKGISGQHHSVGWGHVRLLLFFGSRHTRFSSFHIPEHFQGFYLLGASKSWFSFVSCPMWCVLPCLSQHVRLDIRPAGFGLIPTAALTAKDRCRELYRGSRQVGTATPARPGNPQRPYFSTAFQVFRPSWRYHTPPSARHGCGVHVCSQAIGIARLFPQHTTTEPPCFRRCQSANSTLASSASWLLQSAPLLIHPATLLFAIAPSCSS